MITLNLKNTVEAIEESNPSTSEPSRNRKEKTYWVDFRFFGKHLLTSILGIVILSTFCQAQSALVTPNPTPEAQALYSYLKSTYGHGTLTGAFQDSFDQGSLNSDNYSITGKREALVSLDFEFSDTSTTGITSIVNSVKSTGAILAFQWHWEFEGGSPWADDRKKAGDSVNVADVVNPSTTQHADAMADLATVGNAIQTLKDNNIPILFRPLHEINGGWFWWTDSANPQNTVALYKMIYNYLTVTRGLNNIIWVWNTGGTLQNYSAFYPGDQYCDIIGDDLYLLDFTDSRDHYWESCDDMAAVTPNKMIALCECGGYPNPALMKAGTTPPWLYALNWYGGAAPDVIPPGGGNAWDVTVMRNVGLSSPWMINRDALPTVGSNGNISPRVGIMSPLDDGSARYTGTGTPVIQAYATDADGTIAHVDFHSDYGYADDTLIGSVTSGSNGTYTFSWTNPPAGIHNVYCIAYDNAGASTLSQTVRISTGIVDLAYGQPVTSSSSTPNSIMSNAVDGGYYTTFQTETPPSGANSDVQSVYVDLGASYTISEVDLSTAWKIFPSDYTIDVATTLGSWTTVKPIHYYYSDEYPAKTFDKETFPPTTARYVRLSMNQHGNGQYWGGYNISAIEVPVPEANFGAQVTPVVSQAATASPGSTNLYTSNLSVGATDADHDYLSYTWSVISGNPTGITFSNNGTIFGNNSTVTLSQAGTFTFRCTISDQRGDTTTSDTTVTQQVIPGALPVADLSSQSDWAPNATTPGAVGTTDSASYWNNWAVKFVLQKGITVQSAELRVFVTTSDTQNADNSPLTAALYEGNTDNWTETAGPQPAAASFISSEPVSTGGVWVTYNVTNFVQEKVQEDGFATFVLVPGSTDWGFNINTLHNPTNPPQLIISQIPSAICTDDLSSQTDWSGAQPKAVGATDIVSAYNTWASQFTFPTNTSFTNATLWVYRVATDGDPVQATISPGYYNSSWSETNGPQPYQGAAIETISVPGGGEWMRFDVTSYVQSQLSAGKATFVLSTNSGSWNTNVNSRHNSDNPPQLSFQ